MSALVFSNPIREKEPRYQARCECGWSGPTHDGPQGVRAAFEEALAHRETCEEGK